MCTALAEGDAELFRVRFLNVAVLQWMSSTLQGFESDTVEAIPTYASELNPGIVMEPSGVQVMLSVEWHPKKTSPLRTNRNQHGNVRLVIPLVWVKSPAEERL